MRLLRDPRLLVALSTALVVAVMAVIVVRLGRPQPDSAPPVAGQSSTAQPSPSRSATSAAPSPPVKLVIPKIGVEAVVDAVSVDANNDMAPPTKPMRVGWYAPGVVPGESGDAVIDGHLDWHGVPQAVFFKLDKLHHGDTVDVVTQSGKTLRFRVTGSATVDATAHPNGLFARSGRSRLTLITCSGDWDPQTGQYQKRLLVDAAYVGAA